MQLLKSLKPLSLFLLTILFLFSCSTQKQTNIISPDGQIEIAVDPQNKLQYSVNFNSNKIIENSHFSLNLHDSTILEKFEILDVEESSVNEKWEHVWG